MSYIHKFTKKCHSLTIPSSERRQREPRNVLGPSKKQHKQRNIAQSKIYFQYLRFNNTHTHYSKGFNVVTFRFLKMETIEKDFEFAYVSGLKQSYAKKWLKKQYEFVVYILQKMQVLNGKKRIEKKSPWQKVEIWVLKILCMSAKCQGK